MTRTSEPADLSAAIEESASILDVPYAPEKVQPLLSAYQEALANAPIAFRMGTGKRYSSDVDWRFQVPKGAMDPYSVAVEHGLVEHTDHPVSSLFAEIGERCNVLLHGVDFGAAGGFKKLYLIFPPNDLEYLSQLVDLPSMPRSVAENYGFFARHGLDGKRLYMVALDYRHRTVNLYFSGLAAGTLAPDRVRSIFRDLELPEPSERLLRLGEQAMGVYATLSWDSPKVERFAFSVAASKPSDLPVPMAPDIEAFMAGVQRHANHDTFLYYVAMTSTGEEVFKFQMYYQFPAWLNAMIPAVPAAAPAT